jgi:uncharacterized protein with HEPN domain
MIGLRHRLILGCARVRLELVWIVVQEHLDPLIASLAEIVPDEDGGAS